MNTTKKPCFYINDFLKKFNNESIENIRGILFKKGIYSKYYSNDNIMILYNNYNSINTPLQFECRSLVIDTIKRNIISYGCNSLTHSNHAIENIFLCDIYTSYEGTYISLFCNNNKWYISTRKNIRTSDIDSSKHFDMFIETINNIGYYNLESFYESLDKNLNYHYILIHHSNDSVIDYSDKFGDKYTVLCLVTIRNIDMVEMDIKDFIFPYHTSKHFFVSKSDTYENYISHNEINIIENKEKSLNYEGIIIKLYDNKLNKYIYYKKQTTHYLFDKYSKKSKLVALIALYQNNKLDAYNKCKKSINVDNVRFTPMEFIHGIFKCLTIEFINLFYYYTNNNYFINIDYNRLNTNYKRILKYMNYSSNNDYIKVINYLKSLEIETIIDIIIFRNNLDLYTNLYVTDINYPILNKYMELAFNDVSNIRKILF